MKKAERFIVIIGFLGFYMTDIIFTVKKIVRIVVIEFIKQMQ